ncbi:hypothetical protein [Streptomyces sp. 3213.3]|uniref:hypothetical protein n=1 Tax=Streptomyces sp. 3213.3 TaxID=1855348 RepID=UPI002E0F14F0
MLGGAVIAWRTIQVPTGPLLAAIGCGVVVAAGVGVVRARTAATSVERMQDEQVRRVTEAATAVEKAVVWAAEELCRGGGR